MNYIIFFISYKDIIFLLSYILSVEKKSAKSEFLASG